MKILQGGIYLGSEEHTACCILTLNPNLNFQLHKIDTQLPHELAHVTASSAKICISQLKRRCLGEMRQAHQRETFRID